MAEAEKAQNKSILLSALKVGAFAGASGVLFGGTVGILRSPTPALFAAVAGIQWSLLGSTFWGIRSIYLHTRVQDQITPDTRVYASTIAGGLSFAGVGAVTRGRSNIIPGTLVGTVTGYLGQNAYNYFDDQHTSSITDPEPHKPLLERILHSKYMPVKILNDEEYEVMLREKILKVQAEILILDEDIERLRGGLEQPKVEVPKDEKVVAIVDERGSRRREG